MTIYVLFAHRIDYPHKFSELFSSIENLNEYLSNHKEVAKDSICIFELDPK